MCAHSSLCESLQIDAEIRVSVRSVGKIAPSLDVCDEPKYLWTRFEDVREWVRHQFKGHLRIGIGMWTRERQDEDWRNHLSYSKYPYEVWENGQINN